MTKIAVLIPCYNEEKSIAKVIADVKQYLPSAKVYVYDNNSTDKTAEIAKKSGAVVRFENRQGKGNVVRRMFADIDADVYVMTDGDETYDLSRCKDLINYLQDNNLDMVVGARKEVENDAYRIGHRSGNFILTKLVQIFFSQKLKDMLSGFRVFSREYVKTFPAQSTGFEIETELTVYTLSSRLPMAEIETDYFSRPSGSYSKLSTYKDGLKILKTIFTLVKEERPLLFFSLISLFTFIFATAFFIPIIFEYYQSRQVPHFPTLIVIIGIYIGSFISFLIGIVLDSIANAKRENRRQHYLLIKSLRKKE